MALLAVALWLAGVFDTPTRPPTPGDGGIARPLLASVQSATERLDACEARLQRGCWCGALADAERLLADHVPGSHQLARRAFARAHALWFAAADLPPWLAAVDVLQRQRLFGDLLEPGPSDQQQARALLLGDPDALAALDDPAAHRLLAIRGLEPADRAAAFADYARRFALDQPEHWLARLLEHHARGDMAERVRAAEMAWLSGAGELAVLLDAALAMPTATAAERASLWRRVAAADRDDSPASTLLLLALETEGIADVASTPREADDFPLPHRDAAARWFVAQAAAQPGRAFWSLRVAVALDAEPSFELAPWSHCTEAQRRTLQREHDRAR
jgi:hypothetical protein